MVTLLGRAQRIALDALFPPHCALCGRAGTLLCEDCIDGLPRAAGSRCRRCWTPIARSGVCRDCTAAEPPFTSIRSACVMDDGARRLVHMLKYEGLTSLAEPMAALIADLPGAFDEIDALVPVPLHARRYRARGYNQAAELAKRVAMTTGARYDPGAVRRVRDTAPLVKAMSREERRKIMDSAFAAQPERVDGAYVLLLDDVVTTGATVSSCAAALLDAGAASVRCVTWARAS
jgi:ComF family protein